MVYRHRTPTLLLRSGARWMSGLGCAGLGLERYAQAFRDNDIDADVLPDLTDDDLIRLGINSVGHRRRLLAAWPRSTASGPPR